MPIISYVNGSFVPHSHANVHIEDRGYQFADGVYEVISVINSDFADERGHLDRLERSCRELSLSMPVKRNALKILIRELIRKNRLKNAAVYIQVTRGTSKRDFKYPDPMDTPSSLVLICWPFKFDGNVNVEKGVKVISVPDQRWARRDIKTIALLPQTIAKQAAAKVGAYEAWMYDDLGNITEGSSSNAWIYKDRQLITHKADTQILRGVTRTSVEYIAKQQGVKIIERSFSLEEAYQAEEAFCTSATSLIVPVVQIDEHKIGDGEIGTLVKDIYAQYRAYVRAGETQQRTWNA